MTWFDLADELIPTLRAGSLSVCADRVASGLAELPKNPFHIATDLHFTNPPAEVALALDQFIAEATRRGTVGAVYAETNGFDINPDLWFFNLFGCSAYGGHDDYDWLAEWDRGESEPITLTGMELLQAVFDSPAYRDARYDEASGLASLLVVIRFQSLMSRAGRLSRQLHVPLLATGHDYDFIYEFRP